MPAQTPETIVKLPASARTLDMFTLAYTGCYDRETFGEAFAVDAHNHFRPFGVAAKSMPQSRDTKRGFLIISLS